MHMKSLTKTKLSMFRIAMSIRELMICCIAILTIQNNSEKECQFNDTSAGKGLKQR